MRRSWMVGMVAALALAFLPATGAAQVPKDAGRASEAMKTKDWERRRERIRAAFLKKLGEEMKLDKATQEKMAQSFDRFREQFRTLHQERKALMPKLQAAVERHAPEAEIEAVLGQYEGFRTRRHRMMADRTSEVRQILGTRRYAEYVLFKQKFRKEIRKKMYKRRHK